MGKRSVWWDRIVQRVDLPVEAIPGQSILELLGDNRVLIEGHRGVSQYGTDKIGVNLPFGVVCISGCNLELTHMTRSQLVIRGRIDSIQLHRRK